MGKCKKADDGKTEFVACTETKLKTKCKHDCGEENVRDNCRGKPCGITHICDDVAQVKRVFNDEKAVKTHWRTDCKAFFMVCRDC